ncbi:MAG TPA: S-layer homology domain-containing protein, partial [Acidimicrobiales bacterium]|nr:S-layer homology domain-containing protein [Acidimicrobiales bacterium]
MAIDIRRGKPRRRLVALLLLALVAGALPSQVAVPASGQSAPPEACGDLQVVLHTEHGTLCSHGVDPPAHPVAAPEAGPEATAGIQCYGDGQSGVRTQVVYAYPTGRSSRLASLLPAIRTRAAQIDAIFHRSAAQTGGERHVRFTTDANCDLTVVAVDVPANAIPASGFTALAARLDQLGVDRSDRRYLVYAETYDAAPNSCTGLATVWDDDRAASDNRSNLRVGYGRVDDSCLNSGFDGRIEAHELMHTFGGVQPTAPHATSSLYHCWDEWDRMCYDDDGNEPLRFVCPAGNDLRFDCGNDDYFFASPACREGGYLRTHWNTADSVALERISALEAVGSAPSNDLIAGAQAISGHTGSTSGDNAAATGQPFERQHAGEPGGASVWYRWTPPVSGSYTFDTCGADIDTLLAVYPLGSTTGAPLDENDDDASLGQLSRVTVAVAAGSTYLVVVDGKDDDEGDIALRWGAPPSRFSDVPLGAWNEQAVNWADAHDLFDWLAGTTFSSHRAVNRGQAVQTLWTMLDQPGPFPPHGFPDVSPTAFYDAALDWAKANGLVSGYSDGTFRPTNEVTRGQIVNMLWNMVGRPGGSPPHGFSDVPDTAFYSDALDWAKARGVVTGY